MVSFKKRCLLAFISLLLTPLAAAVYTPASVPDPKKQGQEYYVADPDSLLADSTVQWLNSCAAMLDEKTHVEMAVVALSAIEETFDAFDFSYELFQRWGIGREGQNTGVLILFVLDSHDIRIMTGVGIEGVLTDAQCSKIIRDDMTPAFRAGQYGDGLCLGALRIYEICTDGEAPEELLSIRSVTNRGEYGEDELTDAEIMGIIGVFTGLFILIAFILYWASVKRCPKCGKRRAHATREQVLVAATYATAGQGLRTYCCRNCGNTFDVTFVIPRRQRTVYISGGGRSGMGGFGGGGSWGGGSTFGGGAGGKW